MLTGSVGVEISVFTVVAEKKGIISFGRDSVERKGDAGTFFEKEAFVLEERLAFPFGEKGDLMDDFGWHGKGSPLVSLEFVTGVQVEEKKITFGVSDRGEGNGTGGARGHGVSRLGVVEHLDVGPEL